MHTEASPCATQRRLRKTFPFSFSTVAGHALRHLGQREVVRLRSSADMEKSQKLNVVQQPMKKLPTIRIHPQMKASSPKPRFERQIMVLATA